MWAKKKGRNPAVDSTYAPGSRCLKKRAEEVNLQWAASASGRISQDTKRPSREPLSLMANRMYVDIKDVIVPTVPWNERVK